MLYQIQIAAIIMGYMLTMDVVVEATSKKKERSKNILWN
jgi:hypothetical protein